MHIKLINPHSCSITGQCAILKTHYIAFKKMCVSNRHVHMPVCMCEDARVFRGLCACMYRSLRLMSGVSAITLFTEVGSIAWTQMWIVWLARLLWGYVPCLHLPKARITGRLPCPADIVGSEDLNTGPPSCTACAFSAEPSRLSSPITLFVNDSLRFRLFWTPFFVA